VRFWDSTYDYSGNVSLHIQSKKLCNYHRDVITYAF